MANGGLSFRAQVQQAREKILRNATQVQRFVAIEIHNSLTFMSPVGDPTYWQISDAQRNYIVGERGYRGGRFRANWQVNVGHPLTTDIDTVDYNAQNITNLSKISTFGLGQSLFITNNLPYSHRLEFDSWSRQAREGIMHPTIAKFNGIVRDAVRAARLL